jgi:hypothetical protein
MLVLSMKVTASVASTKWLPSVSAASKLFVTGATLGPLIDGLHNQCLLRYNAAPIIFDTPSNWLINNNNNIDSAIKLYYEPHLFASSWLVPPLLGFAYIVLGGILPRIIQKLLNVIERSTTEVPTSSEVKVRSPSSILLGLKALLAVITTGFIVHFSQYLILHPNGGYGIIDNTAVFESSESMEQHLLILITAAITQWAYLDGTLAALLAASLASVLGPLSELPFVARGIWEYLPAAGDMYFPLQSIDSESFLGQWFQRTWGDQYQTLALNAITGPCYFAVTMDAIALGRWFDSFGSENTESKNDALDDIPTNRLFIASSRQATSSDVPDATPSTPSVGSNQKTASASGSNDILTDTNVSFVSDPIMKTPASIPSTTTKT